jgi:hypothetical protein
MESGIALARELGTHRRLQVLDLGTEDNAMYANRFNNLVGVAFGQTLQNNSTLRELGLNGVGIGRTGDKKDDSKFLASAALGMMLQRNSTLQVYQDCLAPFQLSLYFWWENNMLSVSGPEGQLKFVGYLGACSYSGRNVKKFEPQAPRCFQE